MSEWLAKERRAAAQQAENDRIAKERLAVAWQRVDDERRRLAENLRDLANAVSDYLEDRTDYVGLGQALTAVANALGRYDYPCPHSLVSAEGTCQMCGREGIDLTPCAAGVPDRQPRGDDVTGRPARPEAQDTECQQSPCEHFDHPLPGETDSYDPSWASRLAADGE